MLFNPKQILFNTGGRYIVEPIDASEIINDITWDSRDVTPGCLFVALVGEKVDGHAFVESAIRDGARAVLVNEAPPASACLLARELGAAIIEVPNTYHAISDLARAWRSFIKGTVIGVTGSCGKTSTKNLVRDVAAAKFEVCATKGNQNNELGCPKTILSANPDAQVVVVEMGMDGLGDIAKLCDIARPDWGVLTNVGVSHMEMLGSRENIARAKSELFSALPMGSGLAFIDPAGDYARFVKDEARLAERNIECISYGAAPEDLEDVAECRSEHFSRDLDLVNGIQKDSSPSVQNDKASSPSNGVDSDVILSKAKDLFVAPDGKRAVWAEDVDLDGEGRPRFTLCARGFVKLDEDESVPTLFNMEPDTQRVSCYLSLRGIHNVGNACAAAAVGLALGIDIESVAEALSRSLPETGRLQTVRAREGFTIINDAYNANPDSMRASLSLLASTDVAGKRYAVLGDMGELGDIAIECHKGIGEYAATLDLDALICVGELSRNIASAARAAGMQQDRIIEADTVADVLDAIEGRLEADDTLLVKASNFMGLNRVVEGLTN